MRDFTENTLLVRVRHCKQFKTFKNYILSPYAVCGCSAGGHLAALMCTKGAGFINYNLPMPKILILAYPVITMEDHTHAGSRRNFLGKDYWQDAGMRKKYSVELNIDKEYPDTFLWQCKNDRVVPIKNSQMMSEALQRNEIRYEYMPVDGDAHGWGIAVGTTADGWLEKAIDFWQNKR